MSWAIEKAVKALELLPKDMQEAAADYLLAQARKFHSMKLAVDQGLADVEAGRTVPWNVEEFLREARQQTKS